MRKFFNWHSISVIVILSLGAWVWLGGDSMMSEGEIFARILFVIFLFAIMFILTIIKVITSFSKPDTHQDRNNYKSGSRETTNKDIKSAKTDKQETTNKRIIAAIISGIIGALITIVRFSSIAGIPLFIVPILIFTVSLSALIGVAIYSFFIQIGTDWKEIRKHKKVAFISAIFGVFVPLITVFYLNFSPTLNEWYGPRDPEYGSIVEFTSRNTVKILSPSGNIFHIHYFEIGWCKDDECLKEKDESLKNQSNFEEILSDGARERNNLCYPIIYPPKPPVTIASEVVIFRDCQPVKLIGNQILINMREERLFVADNGNIYSWTKDYEEAYSNALAAFIISSLITMPLFAFLGVTIYRRSGISR